MDTKHYEQLARDQWHEPHIYVPYWNRLPEVIISRCPFTDQLHHQLLDTYSLLGSSSNRYGNGTTVKYTPNDATHSPHLFQVHTFVHLNGELPNKRNLIDNGLHCSEPEIPFITPALLADDLVSFGVIHSLPIRKIWGQVFKEAFTRYVISYYAENPQLILERRKQAWIDAHNTDAYWRVCDYWEQATSDHWDLVKWVKAGKLKWMTADDQLSSDVDAFPYADIEGMRHGYEYSAETKTIDVVNTIIIDK